LIALVRVRGCKRFPYNAPMSGKSYPKVEVAAGFLARIFFT
jgi:hypothetical protein